MEKLEKEIRRILEHVANKGSYTTGDYLVMENIALGEKRKLQDDLKYLLNIEDCDHPY